MGRRESRVLGEVTSAIVSRALDCHRNLDTSLSERYPSEAMETYRRDLEYHLQYLDAALRMESPLLFTSYMQWVKVLIHNLNLPVEDLITSINCIRDALMKELPVETKALSIDYLDEGLKQLEEADVEMPAYLGEDPSLSVVVTQYINELLDGNKEKAEKLIFEILGQGMSLERVYLEIFAISLQEIGRLWLQGEITVAQEHYSTAATRLIMNQLRPRFLGKKKDRMVLLLCVAGELHDVGLKIVADFFEMDGWISYYLGANVPTKGIVSFIEKRKPDVVAISATLAAHVPLVHDTIRIIRESDLGRKLIVIVGGRPFNIDSELWKKVGANGYASNARDAVDFANELVENAKKK
ncbi:MAG: cobalamin-binding protein [Candidatus Thorarchaeota archaeon]|nr:cobalamin-binding protein [Candidatus Thorarchaeota archaeon]